MYARYSKMIQELHEDFSEMLNQKHSKDANVESLGLSEKARRRIETNEIKIKERFIGGGKKIFIPVQVIHRSEKYGDFSIEYKSYNGLVAFNAAKKHDKSESRWKKQYLSHGIFDFYLDAKQRYKELYDGEVTHYNVFQDLYEHVTYDQCLGVYNGEEIIHENIDSDQSDALMVLSWLFFEQELNYGSLDFQQYSNFKKENDFRPRDMIMGFLSMMYANKELFDSYPHWTESKGTKKTPQFGTGGYSSLDVSYKRFFESLKGNLDSNPSLFCDGAIITMFDLLHASTGKNPVLA